MLEGVFTWLLLPLGAVFGWALARRAPAAGQQRLDSQQLGGLLTHLVNEDADAAIAALTQVETVDASTAELHLTLGSLFRKRGEVDRALRIHEALLAQPSLRPELQQQVRYELAQDYLKAGLMDRAEQLLQALASEGLHVVPALEQILGICEQGRDWTHAIETARRLEAAKGESRRERVAMYFCELAEEARRAADVQEALRLTRRALDEDSRCVRAHLLLGALLDQGGDAAAAIKSYRRAFDQDPVFLSEVLAPLARCYEKTADAAGYLQFLADAKELTQSSLPVLAEARLLREEGLDAMPHLAAGLETRPSRAVLVEFLEVMEQKPDVIAAGLHKPAASLRLALRKLMDTSPRYLCAQCGFNPRQQLFWQCPSCKSWNSIKPVEDILRPPA